MKWNTWTFGLVTAAMAASAAMADPAQQAVSTLEDQTDVSVTVYNGNRALVRDARKQTLPTGEVRLSFEGVAEQIQPETVSLRSLADGGSISILEQNYEYDLISPEKLMEKYVGKEVRLVNLDKNTNMLEVTARLLSVNNGPVYQIGSDVYLGYPGHVALPAIPKDLAARPSLVWVVNNTAAEQQIEASYLTGGLSWKADYVLTIPRDESAMDIAGWVTLDNHSGATYTNARLKLVAGEVNQVQSDTFMPQRAMAKMEMAAGAPPMAEQEAFGEYHLYSIPRRTTIKNLQSKQVSLLGASGVKYGKRYEFRGQAYWYLSQMPEMKDQHAEVFLEFENEKDNALGIPLPGGVMRVYQEDSESTLQLLGEDRIQHTPRDEQVRLKLGQAFDVVGDRIQTDFKRIADNVSESAFEVHLRNRKETDITIDIVEALQGDWQILEKSHEYVKRDAQTAVFSIPVKAGEEVKLTYRTRVRY